MTDAEVRELMQKYEEPELPKCRLCGHDLELCAIERGVLTFHCASEAAEFVGRGLTGKSYTDAMLHYDQSEHVVTSRQDPAVVAVAQDYLRLKVAVRTYFDGVGRGYTSDPLASAKAKEIIDQVAKEPPY